MSKMRIYDNGCTYSRPFSCQWLVLLRFLYLLAPIAFISCVHNQDLTGTSSGVETKVAQGIIVKEDGTAAVNARVRLFPADYDPVNDFPLSDSASGVTDDSGRYELYTNDTGVYNVQAVLKDGSRLLFQGIHISDDSTTGVPMSMLHMPGTIKVRLPDDADTVNGYIYLPGTDIFVSLRGKTDSITIDSVPAALFPTIYYTKINTASPSVLQRNVLVNSGDTAVIAFYGWNYSGRIYLNTTAKGAEISENVKNFPVLIRLDNKNFSFNQAQENGSDIRFSKDNGAPLTYEIEHWDVTAGQAAIWVKVDTVYGNDSSQSIIMYWGNPVAGSESNSRGVFDTSTGLQGVWHLAENGELLLDATVNRHNGSRKGDQKRSSGIAGYGQYLNGSGDFTEMGNVCNIGVSDFTFCTWIKKTVTGKRQTIASKSSGGQPSSSYGWLIEIDPDGALFFFMSTAAESWGNSGTFTLASNKWITDTAWHHIAVVVDRSGENKSRMYIDGSDVSSLPATGMMAIGNVSNTLPLRFGGDASGGNPWFGFLDECSISFKTRSQEWIRLSYMNQKMVDQLVEFKWSFKSRIY